MSKWKKLRAQTIKTTVVQSDKKCWHKALPKGLANNKCCLKEDDIPGQFLRQIRGQIYRTTEDQGVYGRDSPSPSRPFGVIYGRPDCQVEDDTLRRVVRTVLWELVSHSLPLSVWTPMRLSVRFEAPFWASWPRPGHYDGDFQSE